MTLLLILLACASRSVGPEPAASASAAAAQGPPPAEALRLGTEAVLLQEAGDPVGAEASLRQLLRFDPRAGWPMLVLGDLARESEDFANARALYEEAVARDPNLVQAWLRLAYERARADEIEGADDALRRAVEVDDSGRAWPFYVAMALDRRRLDLLQQRLADWRSAAGSLDPTQLRVRVLASVHAGDPEGAWDDLEDLLFLEPQDASSLDRYLDLSRELGRRGQALRQIERLLRAYPPPPILDRLAVHVAEEGHGPLLERLRLHREEEGGTLPGEARLAATVPAGELVVELDDLPLDQAMRAWDQDPAQPAAVARVGIVLLALGRSEESRVWLDEAIALAGADPAFRAQVDAARSSVLGAPAPEER